MGGEAEWGSVSVVKVGWLDSARSRPISRGRLACLYFSRVCADGGERRESTQKSSRRF